MPVSKALVQLYLKNCLIPVCPIAAPHADVVVENSKQIIQPTVLLDVNPTTLGIPQNMDLASKQMKDPAVNEMMQYLADGTLPDDSQGSRKVQPSTFIHHAKKY